MRALLLFIFISQLLVSIAFADSSRVEQTRSLLQSIQNRIEQTNIDIDRRESKSVSLKEDLSLLVGELAKIEKRIKGQRSERDKIAKDVISLRRRIESIEERIAKQKPLLHRRLRSLYQGERVGPVALFFSDKNLHQKFSEYSFLAQVAKNDRRLIDSYNADRADTRNKKSALDSLLRAEETILATMEREKIVQTRAKQLKSRLFQVLKKEKNGLTDLVSDLQKREKELEQLLQLLLEQKSKVQQIKPFESAKGDLNMPIVGKVVVGFGRQKNRVLKTSYESRGWMIESTGKATDSWSVTSIWDGNVVYTGKLANYGNMVIVNHGDSYYSLYAQLETITTTVGETVKLGEQVGRLRNVSGEYLYFELREHGSPLNPEKWMKLPI